MKLGTVHRGTVARTREATGSGRVPSGYRLLEKLEDDDRWGRRLWKAEGPGGTRVALVVLEPATDTRQGAPLSQADGERMAALALDDFRSVSHPHLLPVDGAWWMHGAMVRTARRRARPRVLRCTSSTPTPRSSAAIC